MVVKAYYSTSNGGSGVRSVADAKEAEKILRGAYAITTCRLIDERGETVGVREKRDIDGRTRWFWTFDQDAFK